MSENVIKLHLKKTNHSCIEDLVADSRGIADALAKITEDIAIKKAEDLHRLNKCLNPQ